MAATLDLSRFRGAQSASINSGGGSYDQKIPDNDHDPLRNQLDFNDPLGAIADAAQEAGGQIKTVLDNILDGVIDFIEDATGLDLSGLEDVIDTLTSGLDLVTDALTALTSGDPSQLLAFFTELGNLDILNSFPNILGALDGIDLSSPGGILAAIAAALADVPLLGDILGWFGLDPGGDESDLQGLLGSFLTGSSPLDAFNLFNIIPSDLLGMIPYNIVGDATHENLLTNGGFEGAVSVQGNGIWSYDAVNGRTSPGCVSVTANGSEQRLLSNAFPVTAGDKLNHIIYAQWSGLAYTGTPFRMRMVRLLNHNQVGVDDLNSPAGLASSQTGFAYALSGVEYVVPSGCDECCYEITINATCTAGTIKFDDGWVYKDNLLQIPWTEDLPEGLQDLLDGAQETIDTIFEAVAGFSRIGALLSELSDVLQNIPFGNIVGVGGPANIGDSMQATWDQWVGGLVGTVGTGAGLSDLFNLGQTISSWASLGRQSWDLLGIRNDRPMGLTGMMATSTSTIALDSVMFDSSTDPGASGGVACTQAANVRGYKRIEKYEDLGVISWTGAGLTSITNFYVNVYLVDQLTGSESLLYASADILADVGSTKTTNFHELKVSGVSSPITTLIPGDMIVVEFCVRGAGTHRIMGAVSHTPARTDMYPRKMGGTRNSGTSAAPSTISSPTYSDNIPFIETAITTSGVAIPRTPLTTTFTAQGTTPTLPIASWVNEVQVIQFPAGGGGRQGGTWGVSGEGGDNGELKTIIWKRGIDWDTAANPILALTIGTRGRGGAHSGNSNANGENGTNSQVVLPATTGHSAQTLTGSGGEGGDALNAVGSDRYGQSPGDVTVDGIPYVGGVEQSGYSQNGAAPGGGGSGGDPVAFGSGGDGAAPATFIRFKQ